MINKSHLPGRKSYTRSKSLLWTDDKSIKHPSPSIISYSVTQSSRSIFFPLPRGELNIVDLAPFFGDSGVLDLLSFAWDQRTGRMLCDCSRFVRGLCQNESVEPCL